MNSRRILVIFLISILVFPILASTNAANAENGTAAGYTRTITINPVQVPSPQTDFPLLVVLDHDSDLQAHAARADGGDIYFTDPANTTRYPYEMEKYDKSSGSLVAWVKVPSLADGSVIKMWCGMDSGAPRWDPDQVWDDHYMMVQHMQADNSGADPPLKDSTSNGNNGTYQGKPAPAAGKIGEAIYFPGASYIDCGSQPSLDFRMKGTYTWEAWINPRNFQQGGSGIIGKKQTPSVDFQGYEISLGGSGGGGGSGPGQFRFQSSGANSAEMGASKFYMPLSEWTQVLVTHDENSGISLYINGALNNSGTMKVSDDTTSPLYIGWRRSAPAGRSAGFFYGLIDEVEISSVVRSADWILTQYRNQNSPASFYTVSSETKEGSAASTTAASTAPPELIITQGEAGLSEVINAATGKARQTFTFRSADRNAAVTVPQGTLVRDASSRSIDRMSCLQAGIPAAEAPGFQALAVYDFGPDGITFDPPVTINIKYDDGSVPPGVARGDLVLAYLDPYDSKWVNLSAVSVNTLNQTVSGKTGHFTQFAVLAPLPSSAPAQDSEGGFETGSGPNWWLIGINLAVVLAALAYLFLYRSNKRKSNASGK